jgi:hypothetical protein
MDFSTFETVVGGGLLTLAVTEVWNALSRYPRLITRVETLEARRLEDRAVLTETTQSTDSLRLILTEANVKFTNLNRQCEEDRSLNRQMHNDWIKSQQSLGEAVSELRATLNIINQTLLHSQRNNNR